MKVEMSRRKQSNPKYAQQDFEEMRANEITADGKTNVPSRRESTHHFSTESYKEDDAPKAIPSNLMQALRTKYVAFDSQSVVGEHELSSNDISAARTFRNLADVLNENCDARNGLNEGPAKEARHYPERSITGKNSSEEIRPNNSNSESKSIDSRCSPIEYTCSGCGLYFLNRETYDTHVKMYCIIRKEHTNNTTACRKYPWINLQTHKVMKGASLSDTSAPELERLRHTINNIQQSLKASDDTSQCPSCNLRRDDPSHLSSQLCKAHEKGSTQQELAARLLSGILSNLGSLYGNDAVDRNTRSHRSKTEDVQDNISSWVTQALPRPRSCDVDLGKVLPSLTTKRAKMTPLLSFHCIVCGQTFSNDLSLQQHLLSTHRHNSNDNLRLDDPLTGISQTKNNRMMKSRRISTVERPQLSLLSNQSSHRKLPDMQEEAENTIATKHQDPGSSVETNDETESNSDNLDDAKKSNMLGLGRKNNSRSINPSTSRGKTFPTIKHVSDDERRMSCPVVPSVDIALESFPFTGDNVEERHCVECDIKFNSVMNYRAHKKFYCASRHEQRNGDASPFRNDRFHIRNSSASGFTDEYQKHHKRNIGNRSSMTPRKRSHFIPLQTTRQSSNESDREIISEKEPKIQKPDQTISEKFGQNSSNVGDNGPQRRYYCEECKISFSKGDTFIAHKKYYCHTRRKDRSVMRQSVSASKSPGRSNSKDSSDATPPFDRPPGLNGLGLDDGRFLGREGEHSGDVRNLLPTENMYPTGCNISQLFPHPSVVMGNLAMMQPLFMKQYLYLREKMILEASKMGGSSPNLLAAYSTKDRKLSADESHTRSTEHNQINSNLSSKKYRRPARQSCTAAICVKQEDNPWELNAESVYPKENRRRSNQAPSPLDLRQKMQSFGGEDELANSPSSSVADMTQSKFCERENSSPQQESQLTTVLNDQQSVNNVEAVENADASNYENESEQRPSARVRNQICKNCNTRFSSLSTFIAHKKYYCSGSNTTLQALSTNPLDITIKTESNWVNRPHS